MSEREVLEKQNLTNLTKNLEVGLVVFIPLA